MPVRKRCQFTDTQPCSRIVKIVGRCNHCSSDFCDVHRLPEQHLCKNLEDCRQQAFDANKKRLFEQYTPDNRLTMT